MNVSTLIVLASNHSEGSGAGESFLLVFGGAVVGGLVSLGTTLIVERWRSRAQARAAAEAEAVNLKLAARLVQLELRQIESMLRLATGRTPFRWPLEEGYRFPLEAWQQYASQLAAGLSRESWEMIATPYSLFEHVNLSSEALSHDGAQNLLGSVQRALRVVGHWTGEQKLPGWIAR